MNKLFSARKLAATAAATVVLAMGVQALNTSAAHASVCRAIVTTTSTAYSDCIPDRVQWAHRIVVKCVYDAAPDTTRRGGWVGGYSRSYVRCPGGPNFRGIGRAWVEEHSDN